MSTPMPPAETSRRASAGFWSNAASFFLPVGQQIDPKGVRGFPIDMRVKADVPEWPRPILAAPDALHIGAVQYALGCHERWLAGEGDQWLEAAIGAGRHLISIQQPGGAWLHIRAFPHTFPLPAPWASGITQGEGASLLVRLHLQTGDPEFAAAARLALAPLATPQAQGGVQGQLAGKPWPEEYPTEPQSHVLNGAIFALWGMRDVAVGLDDGQARALFEAGLDSLRANLHRYDLGYWSLYSLFPHPVRNRASSFYHSLHVNQLRAMHVLAPHPEFAETADRWDMYAKSRACQVRAFAWKAAFRLAVPRNQVMARRMPWTRLASGSGP